MGKRKVTKMTERDFKILQAMLSNLQAFLEDCRRQAEQREPATVIDISYIFNAEKVGQ